MAVAFGDLGGAVGVGREGAGLQDAGPGAETHGAAHLFHAGELAEFVDDAVGRGGVELAGVGVLEAADVARVFDAGGLHAEADAEVGDVVLAGVADGVEHALDAAFAEAAGDEDAVEAFELGRSRGWGGRLGSRVSRPSASIQVTLSFRLCASAPWTRASLRDL